MATDDDLSRQIARLSREIGELAMRIRGLEEKVNDYIITEAQKCDKKERRIERLEKWLMILAGIILFLLVEAGKLNAADILSGAGG